MGAHRENFPLRVHLYSCTPIVKSGIVLLVWLAALAPAQAAPIGRSEKTGVPPKQTPLSIPGPCDPGESLRAPDLARRISDPDSCILTGDKVGGFFTLDTD